MKLRIKKGFINQDTKKSLVIFDTEESVLYTLNPTARFIFERLKKGSSLKKICSDLTSEFDVQPERARKDLDAFLDILEEKGIISRK